MPQARVSSISPLWPKMASMSQPRPSELPTPNRAALPVGNWVWLM